MEEIAGDFLFDFFFRPVGVVAADASGFESLDIGHELVEDLDFLVSSHLFPDLDLPGVGAFTGGEGHGRKGRAFYLGMEYFFKPIIWGMIRLRKKELETA